MSETRMMAKTSVCAKCRDKFRARDVAFIFTPHHNDTAWRVCQLGKCGSLAVTDMHVRVTVPIKEGEKIPK